MTKTEREKARRERAEMVKELDRLENLRCKKCGKGTAVNAGLDCECMAAVQIREIGKKMMGENKVEKLTVDKYKALKAEKKSDVEICKLFGINKAQIQYFKETNDLKKIRTENAIKPGDPIKGLTVEKYAEQKQKGVTDRHIEREFGIPSTSLYRWVKQNDKEIKSHKKEDKPAEAAVLLKVGYESEQKDREIAFLKNIESDYKNLEVDYLNEKTENERLRKIIEDLKSTYQMNLWLMEQHIMLNKRVEGIVE